MMARPPLVESVPEKGYLLQIAVLVSFFPGSGIWLMRLVLRNDSEKPTPEKATSLQTFLQGDLAS